MQRHKKKPEIGRRYFHGTLSEAIMAKPFPASGHAKGGALFNYIILFAFISDLVERFVVEP